MAAPGRQRTVTVVGKGAASAVPDTALLHLGVETRGASPAPEQGRPMRSLAAEAAPAGPAVQPGEATVWAAVTVTWSLQPPAPPAGG